MTSSASLTGFILVCLCPCFVYTYMRLCTYAYVSLCVYVFVCICSMSLCVHAFVSICVYILVYICTRGSISDREEGAGAVTL